MPDPDQITTAFSTYTRDPNEDDESKIGGFFKDFVGGLAAARGHGAYQEQRMAAQEKRASVANTLRERLFNQGEAQKQQQFAAKQGLKSNEDSERSRKEDFDQFQKTAQDYQKGVVHEAQPYPTQDVQVSTPTDMSQVPEAEREFVSPTQTSTQQVGGGNTIDTKGRPSYKVGGVTMIPTSPGEAADTQQQISDKAHDREEDNFHQQMLQFGQDHPDFVEKNPDQMNQIALKHAFGSAYEAPLKPAHEKLMDTLFETAMGDPNDPKTIKAKELYQQGQALQEKPSEKTKLTPAAIDMNAKAYMMMGEMPTNFSMRGRPDIDVVQNRVAELDPDYNPGATKAFYQANKKSMGAALNAYDKLTPFEQTAKANIDNAINIMNKIPVTGSQFLNMPIQKISDKVLSDSNLGEYIPAFHAAQQVANSEYARVVTLAGQPGVLSDKARNEIQSYNPNEITLNQLKHVVEVYNADADNRRRKAAGTISMINNRFKLPGGKTGGVDALRNILLEDPDVTKEFPDLAGNIDLSKTGAGVSTVGPAKKMYRITKNGKNYDRLVDPTDKPTMDWVKQSGATEVK